jgi:hypothetical protein
MSRRGDCWDNAVAESFFATLKGELVDHEAYATRAAATASIGDYINVFYNTQRRHSTIGYLSPIEFEIEVAIGEADSIVRLSTKSGEAHSLGACVATDCVAREPELPRHLTYRNPFGVHLVPNHCDQIHGHHPGRVTLALRWLSTAIAGWVSRSWPNDPPLPRSTRGGSVSDGRGGSV